MAVVKRIVVFKRGDRVVRVETGQVGTVRRQFDDGYVTLDYDDGRLAELPDSTLKIQVGAPRRRSASGSR